LGRKRGTFPEGREKRVRGIKSKDEKDYEDRPNEVVSKRISRAAVRNAREGKERKTQKREKKETAPWWGRSKRNEVSQNNLGPVKRSNNSRRT